MCSVKSFSFYFDSVLHSAGTLKITSGILFTFCENVLIFTYRVCCCKIFSISSKAKRHKIHVVGGACTLREFSVSVKLCNSAILKYAGS